MRTTVTLDKDVERLLRNAMHRTRRSFKETLNSAVRTALGQPPDLSVRPTFVLTPRPLGLRAGVDPTSFNKLADELEADAFRERHERQTPNDRA
jgi:hypothetical protein